MSDLNWRVHDGSGPYLLLVHGMLSSRNQWLPNLVDLAKVCRPVTVELYGHHEAPTPTEPDQYLRLSLTLLNSRKSVRTFNHLSGSYVDPRLVLH